MNVKQFKLVAVSTNHNAFGLRNHIFVARDGEAFQTLRSICQEPWPVGAVHTWPVNGAGVPNEVLSTCETLTRMPKAPSKLVREIWGRGAK